jgi:hypothetical protein
LFSLYDLYFNSDNTLNLEISLALKWFYDLLQLLIVEFICNSSITVTTFCVYDKYVLLIPSTQNIYQQIYFFFIIIKLLRAIFV